MASRVLDIHIPEALANIAVWQSRSHAIRTHEELRRALEPLDRRGLWYAVTSQCLQVNGLTTEISFIRHPYDEPQHFWEVELVLARAGGAPGRDEAESFSTAAVHVIPDELARQGPSWLIARLRRPGGINSGAEERCCRDRSRSVASAVVGGE